MDAWGGGAWGGMDPSMMGMWGPCKGGCKGGFGPYGKGGGKGGGKAKSSVQDDWKVKSPSDMPDVNWLTIADDSKLAQMGFPTEGCAIEHEKLDVFSEAHYWAQEYFDDLMRTAGYCDFEQDHDGTLYPEIYAAWKAAGKEDNTPLVVTCKKYGVWAVGFGGKKNAERSAKLALATVLARTLPAETLGVIANYPAFGKYLQKIGVLEA